MLEQRDLKIVADSLKMCTHLKNIRMGKFQILLSLLNKRIDMTKLL